MSKVDVFDIFSGTHWQDAKWLESVDNIEKGKQRLKDFAANVPGRYFLFSVAHNSVLAVADTSTSVSRSAG